MASTFIKLQQIARVNKKQGGTPMQMQNVPKLWGVHAQPEGWFRIPLMALPFIIIIVIYLSASSARLKENPNDKLLPSPSKMVAAIERMAFTQDKRTGDYLMLKDTLSSLKRIAIGLGAAALIGLWLGMNMGVFPGMDSGLMPFVRFISIIPPLAILPILFITFGVDELGKIMLIFLGTVFVITRDIQFVTKKIPKEQITKALTLGSGQLQLVYKIILPQVLPRLVETVRLCLGSAWLFLIASEAIASTCGLGYRIFLVRRYMSMDIIIPYVIWITFIGFLMDYSLRLLLKKRFGWYVATK